MEHQLYEFLTGPIPQYLNLPVYTYGNDAGLVFEYKLDGS